VNGPRCVLSSTGKSASSGALRPSTDTSKNREKALLSGRVSSAIGNTSGAAWRTIGSAQPGATTTGIPGRFSLTSSGASAA
jgi:hypothetical protein